MDALKVRFRRQGTILSGKVIKSPPWVWAPMQEGPMITGRNNHIIFSAPLYSVLYKTSLYVCKNNPTFEYKYRTIEEARKNRKIFMGLIKKYNKEVRREKS